MVLGLIKNNIGVHAMRDITRGGLGTVLNELSSASGYGFLINEEDLPVSEAVKGFCEILGLNIMHMGNEGKMVAIVDSEDANKALQIIKSSKYGENARIIGTVTDDNGVIMNTKIGGKRIITELFGEGLPRIC